MYSHVEDATAWPAGGSASCVGNAEIVERVNLLQDHVRAGVFRPLQEAAIAALTGPQDSVEERRAIYERRRERVRAAHPGHALGRDVLRLVAAPGRADRRSGSSTENRVAVAPGEGFGPSGAGWARISLATPDERLTPGSSGSQVLLAGLDQDPLQV